MFGTLLLAQLLVISPSAPPLTPEEAVRVLRGSRSPADMTDVRLGAPPDLPRVVVVRTPAPPRVARVRSIAEVPWAERAAVPWKHVAPAPEDPTIRTVRVIDERRSR